MKRVLTLWIIGICLSFSSCDGPAPRSQSSADRTAPQPGSREQRAGQPDALDKMAAVFVGAPSRERIKSNLDRALVLYGLPMEEENYNRYGSVLVRMRQESGVPEMDILRFVISLREESPNVDVALTDAIALGATTLESVGQ